MDKETSTRFQSLIREGVVCQVIAERHAVRVYFDDRDQVVSDELPVLCAGSAANKAFNLPSIGDVVAVLSATNDASSGSGFVLGAMFNAADRVPDGSSADTQITRYADGTELRYDRASHAMSIKAVGNLTIEVAGDIKVTAKGKIVMNGARIEMN